MGELLIISHPPPFSKTYDFLKNWSKSTDRDPQGNNLVAKCLAGGPRIYFKSGRGNSSARIIFLRIVGRQIYKKRAFVLHKQRSKKNTIPPFLGLPHAKISRCILIGILIAGNQTFFLCQVKKSTTGQPRGRHPKFSVSIGSQMASHCVAEKAKPIASIKANGTKSAPQTML